MERANVKSCFGISFNKKAEENEIKSVKTIGAIKCCFENKRHSVAWTNHFFSAQLIFLGCCCKNNMKRGGYINQIYKRYFKKYFYCNTNSHTI